MHRRRIVAGLEKGEEGERRRPSRRVAGGEEEGYMGWRVSLILLTPLAFRGEHKRLRMMADD
jgi:hypothetical protein